MSSNESSSYQMKGAKILVTGGTGFIGNHVVRLLVEGGAKVRAMVMPNEDRFPLKPYDVEYVEGNLLDAASLQKAVVGVDYVFHLAAIYALWLPKPRMMYDVNVNGTISMLRACKAAGVKRVVYTSSIAAIGVAPGQELSTEDTPFAEWQYGNDYVWSKYISQLEAQRMALQGLDVVVVNPAFPFGMGDRVPTPTGKILIDVAKGKYKGYVEGGFCAVDVEDLAEAHVAALSKGRTGESYILGGRNLEYKTLNEIVSHATGRTPSERVLPGGLIAKLGWMAERVSSITGSAPITTYETTMYTVGRHFYYSNAKAVAELGLRQTPLEDSIKKALAWFSDNGYL